MANLKPSISGRGGSLSRASRLWRRRGITPSYHFRARKPRPYAKRYCGIGLRFSYLVSLFLIVSACSFPQTGGSSAFPPFIFEENNQLYIKADQVSLLVDEKGTPVSTKITDDESLGTVHTFDLLPIIVFPPTRSDLDGLWRLNAWVSSGNSVQGPGYLVTILLGYDDTVIEYDLLPGYLFEYKSGNTETISNIVADLKVGDQIFVHVIGEHEFTDEDMAAITALGFDYPQLVAGHEEENMAILNALASGDQPPSGEIRGVGLIYRGVADE